MLESKRLPREMIFGLEPRWLRERKALPPQSAIGQTPVEEPLVKVWVTRGDGKVRQSHIAANGQVRFLGEPFQVGHANLVSPRDPNGPIGETINCRCVMEVVPISQLPTVLLPQIANRLTDQQRRFLLGGIRVVSAGDEFPFPKEKPESPERNVIPSDPPASGAVIVSVDEQGSSVIIFYSDDTEEVRSGGTRSWRNHNPGNIIAGNHANNNGAIGGAGGIAVFPVEATGKAALLALLRRSDWQAKTLDTAIQDYAPPQDGNPTAAYQKFARNKLGKSGTEKLSSFSSGEISNLANTIIQFEGWQVGTVRYQKFVNP